MGGKTETLLMTRISDTPTYKSWENMVQRCTNPKFPGYENYGGRGIQICEAWRQFPAFLADVGERPAGTSLDRIKVDGHYEPGNCRWATVHIQARNKRTNIVVTLDGVTKCLKDWGTQFGLRYNTILVRLHRGWSLEDALYTPKARKTRYGNQYGVTYDEAIP